MTDIFVYGTLMFPDVVRALTGREFTMADAVLDGFARYAWNDREEPKVPGIIPEPGNSVAGKLLKSVDPASLEILDRFEGTEDGYYLKHNVSVHIPAGGSCEAVAYVAGPAIIPQLEGVWTADVFAEKWLDQYIATIRKIPGLCFTRTRA